jgi:superfamily II DNA helicase RecQ
MSIKVCNIRLAKEHLQYDQNRMNEFLNTVDVKLTTSNFVTTNAVDYWSVLIFYEPKKKKQTNSIEIKLSEEELLEEEKERFTALKNWRNDKAMALGLPHFLICHNSELIALAIKSPKTVADLKTIKGFGENKITKFGKEILSLLSTF